MSKIRFDKDWIFPVSSAVIIGGILAWLLKDGLTPLVTGGSAFELRVLPVKLLLLSAYTTIFAFAAGEIMVANSKVNDRTRVKPAAFLAFVGGFTGALIFYLIYGTGTLDTGRVDWLFNLGDNAQHYLGWVFYRNDPWTWPIGFSCSLGYPTGTCMCFTDSIPLLAIPFKVFSFLLPPTFQYFGLWTLLCFILQGAFAALILYEVTGSRLAAVIAPLFFCTADVLLFRVFRYTPLTGQWIVLFALYLYFRNKRESRWNRLWPLVHSMAVLIQGYFFVMTFVVFCGTLLERGLKDRDWKKAVVDITVSLAGTALTMWVVGFFTASVEMSDAGLGYFKANLNAFFNPLPGWSRFFQPLPLAEGTYAMNVNYLGIGIILLVIIGLSGMVVRNCKAFKCIFCGNWGLLFIVPVLVVFALSNVVTMNDKVLFSYTLPEPLMKLWGVFRGTERMLWPVYYLVFVFAISQAIRLTSRQWVGGLVLLAAFGLQWAEVQPQLRRFHTEFADPQGYPTTLRSDFWQDAAEQFDSVVILPLSLDNWARLTEYAADNRMRINYSYYARYSPDLEPAARQKADELGAGQTQPGELYIIKDPNFLNLICYKYSLDQNFLGYVDGEWVLAPGFIPPVGGYPDVTITGKRANCANLSFAEFLSRYNQELVVMSVMDTMESCGADTEGMSYIGIISKENFLYRNTDREKIEFSAKKGTDLQGVPLLFDLVIQSAGRISGEEHAAIIIDGRDYSYHRAGLNVVAIDPATGVVVDTAYYPLEQ